MTNPDNNMIEKVARALAAQDGHDWYNMPPYREGYYRNARAAIAAMREPSERMLHALSTTSVTLDPNWRDDYKKEMIYRTKYKAMIDAALGDGK